MRRRRRRDYTPEQEKARQGLHEAEMWMNVVASGIAEQLKREQYCGDGIVNIIRLVNGELKDASDQLGVAQAQHDLAFGHSLRRSRMVVIGRKNPQGSRKKKPAQKQVANKKGDS